MSDHDTDVAERRLQSVESRLGDSEDRSRNIWRDQVRVAIAGIVVAFVVAIATAFGTRVFDSDKTGAVLGKQVEQLLDEFRDQRKLLQEMNTRMGSFYTREDAARDREAAERRFQSVETRIGGVESRIGDVFRRIDMVENTNRTLQQLLFEGRGQRRQ